MTLRTERLHSMGQIRDFLNGNGEVDFRPLDREEAYGFVRRTLVRLDYGALGRGGKGTVREFLGKATGLSRAQVTRLIGQYRATGRVEDRRGANSGRPFARVYTAADIRLLAAADEIGGQLCGPAACAVLRREYEVFGDARFERLSRLSPSHLYNLRRSRTYRTRRTTFQHTRPTTVRIGERRRPEPDGKPGHVRVDTVHQGDRDRVKGVYHINLIDEVTQFEHLGAVATIAEAFLVPVLEEMLVTLPFVVLGFHADNGSEYVNHTVAAMLNKLHVPNFTKSRARRSNDNALVEGKNASVVRKWFGHDHIPQRVSLPVTAAVAACLAAVVRNLQASARAARAGWLPRAASGSPGGHVMPRATAVGNRRRTLRPGARGTPHGPHMPCHAPVSARADTSDFRRPLSRCVVRGRQGGVGLYARTPSRHAAV